jgi:hydroxypyruvate isomerase
MPRFAANLTMLFNEVDFLDRFAAAAGAGFRAVEYLFPYDFDKDQLAEKLAENGLSQVLHNLPAGDWAAGERGLACHPDRVGEFQDGVGRAIDYATALGCPRVNCLAGIAPEGTDPEALRQTIIENLRFAAQEFEKAGIVLLAEPINTRDIPGFYLNRSGQALAIIDEVGSANLKLQYESATCRSPTRPAATSPEPARSTTASCSTSSTPAATTAGSAANTNPARRPRRDWTGSRPTSRNGPRHLGDGRLT